MIIGVLLVLILGKQNSDTATLLTIGICVLVGMLSIEFLAPVVRFLQTLGDLSDANDNVMSILLKTVGIGLLAEIGCQICTDAGNASLGKSLQWLASGCVLWLSLPLLESLLEIIRQLLGEI